MKIGGNQVIYGNPTGRQQASAPQQGVASKNGVTSLPHPVSEQLTKLPQGTSPNNRQAMLAYSQVQQQTPQASELMGLDVYV